MLIGCPKCGYENFPQHRYCGMCGGALPIPTLRPNPPEPGIPATSATKPLASPQPTVTQPEPAKTRNLNYLLEDEPEHTSHKGRYVAMVILLGGLAWGGWRYRNILSNVAEKPSATIAAPDDSSLSGTTGAASAAGQDAPAHPDPSAVVSNTPSQPSTVSAPASNETSTPPSQEVPTEQTSSPSATDTDPAEPVAQPEPPPKKVKAHTRTPAPTPDAEETMGENYLYGNGVPQNCTRARQILLAAAQRSNSKAQNVLGTMYATGHCATRDLPTAYRWFARSLHKDPGNIRIEQDLKVLWNQMTPDERNHALQSE